MAAPGISQLLPIMSEWISGTSKILVAGQRVEIGKLFELLLSQHGRQFVHAKNPSHCFDLALKNCPHSLLSTVLWLGSVCVMNWLLH